MTRVRGLVALTLVAALAAACTTDTAASGQGDTAGEAAPAVQDDEAPTADDLQLDGPEPDAMLGADALGAPLVTVTGQDAALEGLALLVGGEAQSVERGNGTLSWQPASLDDGPVTVELVADDEVLHTWTFEVRTTPPSLEVTGPPSPVIAEEPVTVTGRTEPGVVIEVAGSEVVADDDGAFTLALSTVSPPIVVRATDAAGNTAEVAHEVAQVASRVELEELRTVHMTFWAWASPQLREPVEAMIDEGRINAVQLDLKDESGQVGYDSEVAVAQQVGAVTGAVDLEAEVAALHAQGIAVVGRIVAFADPLLASWAWDNGNRDWVIQLPDGNDFYRGSYAGFSNYTHPEVIDYLLDLAEEAAAAGVDHILWDYIRRPEGIDSYVVPGLTTTPEQAIADFARQADERLAPYGVQHGASVYGIAADRPTQIGQDIPSMAEHLDYVAPMIYPSHWGTGEYGIADPNRQPYDIVRATLAIWQETVADRRARVVPWLEDTNYRAWDRPFQVREQLRGARDEGIDEWLMWNPGSSYTTGAYEPRG